MPFPVNYAQRRKLRMYTRPERLADTVEVFLELPGGVPSGRVRSALRSLLAMHEALRGRITYAADGEPGQTIAPVAEALDLTQHEFPDAAAVRDAVRTAVPRLVDPEERAAHADLYLVGDRVHAVVLTVSHVFADGFCNQIIYDDLAELVRAGQPPPGTPRRRQASAYSGAVLDPVTAENTAYWKKALRNVPRASTFTVATRGPDEVTRTARTVLDAGLAQEIVAAARALRASTFVLWAVAMSIVVSRCTRQDALVFRSITANRFEPEDLRAVANLANPLYIPVHGGAGDRVRDWVHQVAEANSSAIERGRYDVAEVLASLVHGDGHLGAAFRPAFDINFLVHPQRPFRATDTERGEIEKVTRFAPEKSSGDLTLFVWPEGESIGVSLTATEHVYRGRSTTELLTELVSVVRLVCAGPDRPVSSVDIAAFPGVEFYISGHRSGVAVSLDAMRRFLKTAPGVVEAAVHPKALVGKGIVFRAAVRADQPVSRDELLARYRRTQPWTTGTVIPDELSIAHPSFVD